MSKFNQFNVLFEKAFSHYANGGAFRENTPVKIKPALFNSDYYKSRYGGDEDFTEWLKNQIKMDRFFFIHKINASGSMMDVKDANDYAGSPELFLTLKTDPRALQNATEYNEFIVPADYKYIEVLKYGINLPPVQGVPNKYEQPIGDQKPTEVKVNTSLGNQPKDNSLPKSNVKI
jgi:hypothetical protein